MPLVDVLDDTFVRAGRAAVRHETGSLWGSWLPGLRLRVAEDRAEAGVRWSAVSRATARGSSADLAGTAEVWLEAVPGGTVVHLYVRLDPARSGAARPGWRERRLPDRLRVGWKRGLNRSKDLMEGEWPG
ncbi:hypothetical protein [Jannaschia sp. R86511]|uniref:hypothetical protein n=1 Tax=Jannaschia sp. R86511 TaxID=3093853 RepID=UPI0036D39493